MKDDSERSDDEIKKKSINQTLDLKKTIDVH